MATFLLGAVLAFGYSYVPLHRVKDRKLVRLESTLLEQEETIASLEGQLESLQVAATAPADEDRVASLESDRDEVKREMAKVRAALDKAQKRSKSLERERNDWKGRVARLERQIAELPTVHLAEREDASGPVEPATAEEPARPVAGSAPPRDEPDRSAPLPAAPAP
jgi:septal ring factor EnvC (AmiA/AmiB activator)